MFGGASFPPTCVFSLCRQRISLRILACGNVSGGFFFSVEQPLIEQLHNLDVLRNDQC